MDRLEDFYHNSFDQDELLEAALEHERRERELQEEEFNGLLLPESEFTNDLIDYVCGE
ncbi:MAG: hypothetical protein K0B37_10925 [Bacteroidales bacterium]|nr:hypothetical protein [Bacteroidales bacterium]